MITPLFSGISVVDRRARASMLSSRPGASLRASLLGLSLEEGALRYRGPDSAAVSEALRTESGLRPELGLVRREPDDEAALVALGRLGGATGVDRTYCRFYEGESHELEQIAGAPGFLGFDYLYWGFGEWAYSIVFHEVLFGREPDLARLALLLNESLLIPSEKVLAEVRQARHRLVDRGADLETADEENDGPYVVGVFELGSGSREVN